MTSIHYANNAEYRAIFRQITNQPPLESVPRAAEDDDDETYDENAYEEACVSEFLITVFTNTRDNPLFHRLYIAAAAKMISQTPDIGMAILMSYDYLWAFYPCYCSYIENPTAFTETNEWYAELERRLQ